MAPADVANHNETPALWRKELAARREIMATEVNRPGASSRPPPPAWAAALAPVPSDPARQEQWRQLAVEISTYHDIYRIPASEAALLPADHQDKGVGSELTARVTALHKYTTQTARDALSAPDTSLMAEAAHVEAVVKETPTPAEEVVDHLQQARGAEAQLSPAQERAERLAELVRKVRQNRAERHGGESEARNPKPGSSPGSPGPAQGPPQTGERTGQEAQPGLRREARCTPSSADQRHPFRGRKALPGGG